MRIAIISDIHYASAAERARRDHVFAPIKNPVRRWLVRQYRRHVWMRDPFAHNSLLDRFIEQTQAMDRIVANGDYSCDSAYIGVSDDAAFQSARECLEKLRRAFGSRFHATIGDHEIGKKMLAANEGGLRLASYHRACAELELEPLWKLDLGRWVLIGVTSTLVGFPLYQPEALPEEQEAWHNLRQQHLKELSSMLDGLKAGQRVLLFCHDPSALPFLGREATVRSCLPQIERTIIGHLHTPLVYHQSRLLTGMPRIDFLGHTPKRLSSALREARHWRVFRPLLCPSLAGIQLLKDGGYYVVTLSEDADAPARFEFHPLPWLPG